MSDVVNASNESETSYLPGDRLLCSDWPGCAGKFNGGYLISVTTPELCTAAASATETATETATATATETAETQAEVPNVIEVVKRAGKLREIQPMTRSRYLYRAGCAISIDRQGCRQCATQIVESTFLIQHRNTCLFRWCDALQCIAVW